MIEPRHERWLSLLEVATLAKINLTSAASRRRKVLRLVRALERRGHKITKKFGSKVYVSANSLELLFPAYLKELGRLEREIEKLAESHADVKRKVRGHGSRIRKLESGFGDTAQWLAKMQAAGWVKSES